MTNRLSFLRWIVMGLVTVLIVGAGVMAQETCDLPLLIAACAESPADAACAADGTITPLAGALPAELPQVIRLSAAGDGELTLTLVGSQLTRFAQAEFSVQVEIGNRAGYNVNMRGGPGSNFDVVGIFRFDARLMADGRTADGAWLRVQLEDGTVAWVSASLATAEPELETLPVVDQTTTGALGYNLTLTAADSDCGDGGAFVTATGETTQRLIVNMLPLALANGVVYLVPTETHVLVYALAGDISVGTDTLTPGDVIAWSDGVQTLDVYPPFPSLGTLDALTITPEACLIAGDAPTYVAARSDAEPGAALGAGSYAVTEQADGAWYHLSGAYGGAWVAADDVMTLGACADLADANATPVPRAAFGAGMTPEQIMYSYLQARITGDANQMQALACASWDANALMQAQSFRAMRAQLNNVVCTTVAQSGATAVVHCDGTIQTEYNGELRQWELGDYAMTQESGAWRMCGEAG